MATRILIRWTKAGELAADDPVLAVAAALDHDFAQTWTGLAGADLVLATDGEHELLGAAVILEDIAMAKCYLLVWSIGAETRDQGVSNALLNAVAERARDRRLQMISAVLFPGSPMTERAFSRAGYRFHDLAPDGRAHWECELA